MTLDLPGFNDAFNRARDRVRSGVPDVSVVAEQDKLRALVPADASDHDRVWTARLIDRLAEPPKPARQWSNLFHEADRIHAAAYPPKGTTEQRIAMLAEAREQIWTLADRATEDEQDYIRAMTQDLEHLEKTLRNPPTTLTDRPFQPSDG
ncbi:hypothetical protein ACFV9C_22525 [Kribbella sp. NPDC059898]|uniref:hypothetical protein n=1 Tax=Kribbella sp. NPDC059898 TaxID=3346995 RepID=UPI00364A69B7